MDFEGCDLVAKPDTIGFVIGRGHNGPDVFPRLVWTQAQADAMFALDYAKAVSGAIADVGNVIWAALNEPRQAALADMSFELGSSGLHAFHDMIASIANEDWQGAHDNLLASPYAQTEVPTRANANAAVLLSGQWPA
jgi:lysozyme